VGGHRAEQLLRLPVRLNGLEIGRAVDVVIDPGGSRALGLDVLCRDEVHRFLPLAAADVARNEIRLESPFTLVDDTSSEFYRGRATTLRTLKGVHVERAGQDLGPLQDVVVSTNGEIEAFVVETDQGSEDVAFEPGVALDGDR
jgi:uncharacterized protein YrrD